MRSNAGFTHEPPAGGSPEWNEPLTGWCPNCREKGVTFNDGRCVWCDTPTESVQAAPLRRRPRPELLEGRPGAKLTRRQVEAAYQLYCRGKSMGVIARLIYQRFGYKSPETCASALQHAFAIAGFEVRNPRGRAAASTRKVPDELVDEAWARYSNGEQLPAIAQDFFASGRTDHDLWERLYECVIRQFRARGYPTRSRAENLAGRACRTEKTCARLNNRGKPCGANVIKREDGTYGDHCWQHDESYSERRDAIVHMERMRAARRWVNELVPIAPFAAWLARRRTELALPPERRRFSDRDESLTRLSAATGIDASTLIKWMRCESSKGKPKHTITESKVREVLERDGSTSFEDLYPAESEVLAA